MADNNIDIGKDNNGIVLIGDNNSVTQILTPTLGKEAVENESFVGRAEEIEKFIISNDLTTATQLLVDLASNSSKKLRRESILHQSKLNAINEKSRKFGHSSELDRELTQLKNSLFEFLEILGDR